MKTLLGVIFTSIITSSIAFACDPNVSCTRELGRYPCPTWKKPGRTCPIIGTDPVCEAEKTICRASCSNINNDANGYILTNQTMINKSIEAIKTHESEMTLMIAQLASKAADLQFYQQSTLSEVESYINDFSLLVKSHETIKAFIEQQKIQNEEFSLTEEKAKELAVQYKDQQEILRFLEIYTLSIKQDALLFTLVSKADTNTLFLLMEKSLLKVKETTLSTISMLETDIELLNSNIKNKENLIGQEKQNIEIYRRDIQNQEARKCAPLL